MSQPLSIRTSHDHDVCDVCTRTLLRGENIEVFVNGSRRYSVCELCKPHALQEGWVREGAIPDFQGGGDRVQRRRSLFGRGAVPYPRLPDGYLGEEAVEILMEFERHANAADMDPRELWPTFPFDEVAATVENTWASISATLYANWLRLARAAAPYRARDAVLRRAAA